MSKSWSIPGTNLVLSRDKLLPIVKIQPTPIDEQSVTISPYSKWEDFAITTTIRSGVKFIPFKAHPYQQLMSELLEQHDGMLITKSRQLGITQWLLSHALWKGLQNGAFVAVFIAKNQNDSAEFAKRLRLMATSAKIELRRDSASQIQLANGATFFFRPCTENAARSLDSVSWLVFDEWAFVDIAEDLYSAAVPTLSVTGSDAKIIVLSTPNGMEGFYWDLLTQANGDRSVAKEIEALRDRTNKSGLAYWTDESGWCKFMLHWSAHPIYGAIADYVDRQRLKFKMPRTKALQEFDLFFGASASQVFAPNLIESIEYHPMLVWTYYDSIVIGVDPAYGGDDAFCTRVWSLSNNEARLIDEVHENDRNRGIKRTLDAIDKYKPALKRVKVEVNGGGALIADRLEEANVDIEVERITTTNDRKISMTDNLVYLLEDGVIKGERDQFEEYLSFRETKKGSLVRREAARSGHDDRVMADAIALYQTDDLLELGQEEVSIEW